MVFLGIIGITLIIIGVMALMSKEEPKTKKKNWFVRQGELLDDDYYW